MMDDLMIFSQILVAMFVFVNCALFLKSFDGRGTTADDRFRKSEHDGLLYFQEIKLIEYLRFGEVIWDRSKATHYVVEEARQDAENNEYNNVFGDDEMKEYYDKTFKVIRETLLKKAAVEDAMKGVPNKVSNLPAEQAIYQEAYFKKAQEVANVRKVLHERIAGLYANDDEKNAEPLSYEDFKMMMQISA